MIKQLVLPFLPRIPMFSMGFRRGVNRLEVGTNQLEVGANRLEVRTNQVQVRDKLVYIDVGRSHLTHPFFNFTMSMGRLVKLDPG